MKSQRSVLKQGAPASRRCILIVLAALLTSFSLAAIAAALTVDGTSRSYLLSRETAGGTKLLPGYEYLDLSVRDIGGEAISVHFGGWGRFDFRQETGDKDVQYAFVSYKRKEANSVVNLGRVMVFEGVAAERVDGAYVRTDLLGGLGFSAFGGSPVDISIDVPGNNVIYGARVSHQVPALYAIGLSFLKAEKNDLDFRKEQGVDLWFRPLDKIELLGRSAYNADTKGWMEHAYNLILGPFDKVRLNTEVSAINYRDYFTGVTSAAFLFSLQALDPNEKLSLLGEEVAFAATDKLAISANYRSYKYDIAGDASSYGAKVTYSSGKNYGSGISVRRMDGDTKKLQYNEYRMYAYRVMGKTDVAVDLIDLSFDEAINDMSAAYSASLAVGYELSESFKIGADLQYAKNPFFDKDVRAFAKIIYSFDAASSRNTSMPAPSSPAPVATPAQPAPDAGAVSSSPAPAEAPVQAAPEAAAAPAAPATGMEQGAPKAGAEQGGATGGTEQIQRKEGAQ